MLGLRLSVQRTAKNLVRVRNLEVAPLFGRNIEQSMENMNNCSFIVSLRKAVLDKADGLSETVCIGTL